MTSIGVFKLSDRLLNLWENVHTSLWFVPTVMVLLAIWLSLAALGLDETLVEETLTGYPWIFTGSPEAARHILSTIAGSVMTVAALSFSLTMVAVTMASSQFGPRILRNFIKDTGNQVVLGTFLATYLYCLIVLRSVRGLEDNAFVPQVSITLAIVLVLASIGVLIYFTHHVIGNIQVNNIVAGIGDELEGVIRRIYPARETVDIPLDWACPPKYESMQMKRGQVPVLARKDGYLQTIDYSALLAVAVAYDIQFRISLRPGEYVIQRHPLLYATPAASGLDTLDHRVNQAFILGARQTPTQDVEFSVDQLVEIAVRALSPSINDPFTAIACIDHLGNALALLFRRHVPSPYYYDENRRLRIITRTVTVPGVIDAAFNQIRQYGRDSASVTTHLLETISRIALDAQTDEVRHALYRQALIIERNALGALPEQYDRLAVKERAEAVMEAISISRLVHPGPTAAPRGNQPE